VSPRSGLSRRTWSVVFWKRPAITWAGAPSPEARLIGLPKQTPSGMRPPGEGGGDTARLCGTLPKAAILPAMRRLEHFTAVPLGAHATRGDVQRIYPLPSDRWLLDCRVGPPDRFQQERRELVVVDASLQPVWRLQLPARPPGWSGAHAVSDDLSMAALALPRAVQLLDRAGELIGSFPYPGEQDAESSQHDAGLGETGGCAFSSDGRHLWACVPCPGADEELRDELWLIDLPPGQVVDRRQVGAASRWVRFHRHPDGQTVALRRAYTLEEPTVWARPLGDRIDLPVPEPATVLADIHPAGREYLDTSVGADDPSDEVPSVLARYCYPDHGLLERLPAARVLPHGYRWSSPAYLTEELLVAMAWSSAGDPPAHLLVRRAPLLVLGAVRYPGHPDDRLPGAVAACHAGRWLTISDGTVHAWALGGPPGRPGV
jgi:hypothetical protein